MVPNTVTPLPDEAGEDDELALVPDEPVLAQPETSRPIAMAKAAAMNGFTENSRGWWDCGHYRPPLFFAL